MSDLVNRLSLAVLRLLGAPCGDYGGQFEAGGPTRWCLKRAGHRDSHAYDFTEQPLRRVRLRAQGWDRALQHPYRVRVLPSPKRRFAWLRTLFRRS